MNNWNINFDTLINSLRRVPKKRRSLPVRERTIEHISIGGIRQQYMLVRSRMARSVNFRITQGQGLEVIVPYRFALSQLPDLIRQKEVWIIHHLSKMKRHAASAPRFQNGAIIEILGIKKQIHLITESPSSQIRETSTEIFISTTGSELSAKRLFNNYIIKKAKKFLPHRLAEISHLTGLKYGRLTIRSQKTRWGSCSRENNLNLNWKLILLPLDVMDYVIIHELAHTIHHNHSAHFWALVASFCPDYKRFRASLRAAKLLF